MFVTVSEGALNEKVEVHVVVRLVDEGKVDIIETEDGEILIDAASLAQALRHEELEVCEELPKYRQTKRGKRSSRRRDEDEDEELENDSEEDESECDGDECDGCDACEDDGSDDDESECDGDECDGCDECSEEE